MRIANKVMKIPETHTSSTFSKKTSKRPQSAVFVPESAVFRAYDLEVSRFFRNFAVSMIKPQKPTPSPQKPTTSTQKPSPAPRNPPPTPPEGRVA